MLFNSQIFFIFAIIFFAIWPRVKRTKNIKFLFIISASFLFYGWWDWRFLFLIIFSGLIDYFAAFGIAKYKKAKKLFLMVSLLGNLGTLAIFKYSQFFVSILNDLLVLIGLDIKLSVDLPEFFIILPVGISFYTFQSMSYTIDVYKGRLSPTRNILHFFSYLSMFPQLVAGPIVRAKDILDQLIRPQNVTSNCYQTAYKLIVYGYLKKVVIADNLAPIVNHSFANLTLNPSSMHWWAVMIAFALQIYADFSGYSDIAIGLGRLMGLRFKRNFNHPYNSNSFKGFWERWHISLSSWFRDYVYVPLGGSKCSKLRTSANLWVTMILSGLWHGASWNFIIWGALHASFLSIEKALPYSFKKALRPLSWLVTFLCILIAWVFFRAESMEQALNIVKIMFSFKGSLKLGIGLNGEVIFGLVLLRHIYCKYFQESFQESSYYKGLINILLPLAIATSVFFRGPGGEFIYFQF